MLKSIYISIKRHVVAKLDQIIESNGNESQTIMVITLSITIFSLMVDISLVDNNNVIIIVIMLCIFLVSLICQLHFIKEEKSRKSIAIYFKTLFEESSKENI